MEITPRLIDDFHEDKPGQELISVLKTNLRKSGRFTIVHLRRRDLTGPSTEHISQDNIPDFDSGSVRWLPTIL